MNAHLDMKITQESFLLPEDYMSRHQLLKDLWLYVNANSSLVRLSADYLNLSMANLYTSILQQIWESPQIRSPEIYKRF